MLTQCPSCRTTFRITGNILRAAHGQVRCGQCSTQFDAIEYLSEGESPTPLAADEADAAPVRIAESVPVANIEVEEPLAEEITLEGRRIEISGVYRTLDLEAGVEEEPHTETIVQEFAADEFVEPEDAATSYSESEAELKDYLEKSLGGEAADEAAEAAKNESGDAEPPPITANTPMTRQAFADADTDLLAPSERHSGSLIWTLLCIALAIALAAQAVHHFRQDLSRRADVGPKLVKLYSTFGLPLHPRWELNAYSLKQWGVVSDRNAAGDAGTLRVRASIANNAAFAQPYPLLKLTLEDRFGAEVAMREFKPEEYLTSSAQAKRLLAAGESTNADIAIVDPGEDAVGFQLKVCLSGLHGVECIG